MAEQQEQTTSSKSTSPSSHNHTNRLSSEHSPYLLQHAQNPVDWYPWGEEAFKEALKRDVPIFLSTPAIGVMLWRWSLLRMKRLQNCSMTGLLVSRWIEKNNQMLTRYT